MRRRISLGQSVAIAAVLMAAPLAAQSTNVATPAPTPTPAPAGDAVGPPQLRDFNLNGTVTQPAQPATPTPAPSPAQSPPASGPAPRATQPPAPPVAAPGRAVPAPRLPTIAAPDRDPMADAVTVDLPPLAPDTSLAPAPDPVADALPAAAKPPGPWWPWLATLLAVALGAGLLWRRRQQQVAQNYAADHAALGALVAVPDASPVLPRASPTPPRPAPRVPFPAPAPAPVAAPPAVPVPDGIFAFASTPPAQPPLPDGIFASRLKPQLEFELVPIRAETDAAEGAALTFDLIVINRGSAPARDVLIEAKLINAGPRVNTEVGRFFGQPAGGGERLPLIAPMGRLSLRLRLTAAKTDLSPLVVEGRKLLVPVVAINALYRWSGGELKDSSSFLVGRGEAEGGKMAPFRLDRGARSWSGLAARLHSSGLQG